MRIVVNDIAASKGGALAILKQFYNYVKDNGKENEWIFLLGDNYIEETQNVRVITLPEIKKSRLKKVLFDCFTGRKFIKRLKPDLVISLQNIITFGVKVPQYVYVHQAIPFQSQKNFSLFKKKERAVAIIQKFIGRFIIRSVKRADKVVVQTNWMKEAVVKKAKIDGEKVVVSTSQFEFFAVDETLYRKNRFFYPTSDLIYKNNDVILKACDLLNNDGIYDFEVILTLKEGTVLHKNVKCVGYLDGQELQREYQSANLVFPSYIESLGLPLLEAKSCNVPILASDTPFSHECLAGYDKASYFNAFNEKELYCLMKKFLIG